MIQFLHWLKSLESALLLHIGGFMEHISIDEIVHAVLRDQEQETIQVVVNKLADECIKKGLGLTQSFRSRVGNKICLKGTLQLGRDALCK